MTFFISYSSTLVCLKTLTVSGLGSRLTIKSFAFCTFKLYALGQLLTSTVKKHLQASETLGADRTIEKLVSHESTVSPLFRETFSVLWVAAVHFSLCAGESLCLSIGRWAQNIKGEPPLDSHSVAMGDTERKRELRRKKTHRWIDVQIEQQ